jgi:signal peptidase
MITNPTSETSATPTSSVAVIERVARRRTAVVEESRPEELRSAAATAASPTHGDSDERSVNRAMTRIAGVAALLSATFLYFLVATAFVSRALPLLAGWEASAVMSGSMAPAIQPGDLVAFMPYRGPVLAPGTIVSFEDPARPGTVTTHRIVEVRDDSSYVTKGDANPTADSTPVTPEMIRGVARMVYPNAALPSYWWATQQYAPLAALILVTALAMVIYGGRSLTSVSESDRAAPTAPPRKRRVFLPTVGIFTTMALVGVALASFTSTTTNAGNVFSAAASFGPEPPSNLVAAASCPAPPGHIGASSAGGESDTATFGKPAGVAAGDLMLASFITRQSVAVDAVPAGWQLLLTEGEMRIYYKTAGASEPSQYPWGLSQAQRWAGGITAYQGVDPTSPIDAFGSQTSSGTSVTAPSITTTLDDALLVVIFARQSRSAISQPAGMAERWDVADTGPGSDNSGVASEAADEAGGTAGSTGQRSATSSGNRAGHGALIALSPAGFRIELTWEANPSSTADGYVLERWTGGALDASWVITPATTTKLTDTGAQKGVSYTYRLRAFQGSDESPEVEATITPSC